MSALSKDHRSEINEGEGRRDWVEDEGEFSLFEKDRKSKETTLVGVIGAMQIKDTILK